MAMQSVGRDKTRDDEPLAAISKDMNTSAFPSNPIPVQDVPLMNYPVQEDMAYVAQESTSNPMADATVLQEGKAILTQPISLYIADQRLVVMNSFYHGKPSSDSDSQLHEDNSLNKIINRQAILDLPERNMLHHMIVNDPHLRFWQTTAN
ncbi:hypothetical protein ACH5RR_033757 [Cinchona calisaya]|uniref:Uncharacterized protein n=1 Tax=Cinchona calisaya TaxID=153742 RepID=A0ABD2Y8X3_9GENT